MTRRVRILFSVILATLFVLFGFTVGSARAAGGDLNGSGCVDIVDLGILLSAWGRTDKPPADLNQSGSIDVVDLGILLSNWGCGGTTPPPPPPTPIPAPAPIPVPTPPPAPVPLPPTFQIGDTVQATANLNVRSSPSASAGVLAVQSPGEQGAVIGGPTQAESFAWWQVRWDDGTNGWSVGNYLAKVTNTGGSSPGNFATVCGREICIGGEPFFLKGHNLIPGRYAAEYASATWSWNYLMPYFLLDTVYNKTLDLNDIRKEVQFLKNSLRINAIRMFTPAYNHAFPNEFPWFDPSGAINPPYRDRLLKILDILEAEGIRVQLNFLHDYVPISVMDYPADPTTCNNTSTAPQGEREAFYRRYFESLMPYLKDRTNIIAYEIANESMTVGPGVNEEKLPTSNLCPLKVLSFTTRMIKIIKALDPNHLITSGEAVAGAIAGVPTAWYYPSAEFACLPNIDNLAVSSPACPAGSFRLYDVVDYISPHRYIRMPYTEFTQDPETTERAFQFWWNEALNYIRAVLSRSAKPVVLGEFGLHTPLFTFANADRFRAYQEAAIDEYMAMVDGQGLDPGKRLAGVQIWQGLPPFRTTVPPSVNSYGQNEVPTLDYQWPSGAPRQVRDHQPEFMLFEYDGEEFPAMMRPAGVRYRDGHVPHTLCDHCLLWTSNSNAIQSSAAVWALDSSDNSLPSQFESYDKGEPGWKAVSFLTLDDGTGRLLWSNNGATGVAELWILGATKRWRTYGPAAGWVPKSYTQISAAGPAAILWERPSDQASYLWELDAAGNTTKSSFLPPQPGWVPFHYALGRTAGAARLLWEQGSEVAVRRYQNGALTGSDVYTFGLPAGWKATGYFEDGAGNEYVTFADAAGGQNKLWKGRLLVGGAKQDEFLRDFTVAGWTVMGYSNSVAYVAPQNKMSCVSNSIPSSMSKGQTVAVSVRVKNTGGTTWTASGAQYYYLVKTPGSDSTFTPYVALPSTAQTVAPGGEAEFVFSLTAPNAAGAYPLIYQMAQQGVEFFGPGCGPGSVAVQ